MPKDPIRITGTKVKGIKIGPIIDTIPTMTTTTINEGYYDRNRSQDIGSKQVYIDGYHTNRNGAYVPPANREGGVGSSRIREMFDELLKTADAQDETLKEIKEDI